MNNPCISSVRSTVLALFGLDIPFNDNMNGRVFYGFCPDHGCHLIDGGFGSHGLDMPEDMDVVHLYGVKSGK